MMCEDRGMFLSVNTSSIHKQTRKEPDTKEFTSKPMSCWRSRSWHSCSVFLADLVSRGKRELGL
eukprot:6458796-Amphidinium_carterae.2